MMREGGGGWWGDECEAVKSTVKYFKAVRNKNNAEIVLLFPRNIERLGKRPKDDESSSIIRNCGVVTTRASVLHCQVAWA